MPQASRTISINVPPEKAFAFFTDPANDQRWRTHVKEVSASGPPAVGSRIHQVIAGPGGRGIAADIEITAYEPPSRYAFQVVAGPARPHGEYRISPNASGGSDVAFSIAAQLNPLFGLFMGGQVQASMDGEMANLDRAKAILEGG
jgi:uncharacterized protein YndB with AHSA1/START domain